MSAHLYRTTVSHVRTRPISSSFSHRQVAWLVDLDDLPRLPAVVRRLASFDARDHVGDPTRSLRENIDGVLVAEGVDVADTRIELLAQPRALGYAFNPLSVFWCIGPGEEVRAVVAEVQNTHGERHCYVLRPDASARAEVDKAFYVSPFLTVDGRYLVRCPRPGDTVTVDVSLVQGDEPRPIFAATVRGRRVTSTRARLAWAAVRDPLRGRRVVAMIRVRGLVLWLRRLPVVRWSAS